MKLLLEGFRRGSVPSVGERSLRTRLFMDPKVLRESLAGKSEELLPRTGFEASEEPGLSEEPDMGLSEALDMGFNDVPALPADEDPKRSSSMTSWRLVNERSFRPETTGNARVHNLQGSMVFSP